MPQTIVNAPANGGNVAFTGMMPPSTPCNGTMPTTTTHMAYQVDTGNVHAISNFNAATGTWNVPKLTASDCPTVGQTYTVTVYAYDGQGNTTPGASTFKRTA